MYTSWLQDASVTAFKKREKGKEKRESPFNEFLIRDSVPVVALYL